MTTGIGHRVQRWADVTGGAGHALRVPINVKMRDSKAMTFATLAMAIDLHGTEQIDPVPLTTIDQVFGFHITTIHDVGIGQ